MFTYVHIRVFLWINATVSYYGIIFSKYAYVLSKYFDITYFSINQLLEVYNVNIDSFQ